MPWREVCGRQEGILRPEAREQSRPHALGARRSWPALLLRTQLINPPLACANPPRRQRDILRQKSDPDPADHHEFARITLQLAKWTAAQVGRGGEGWRGAGRRVQAQSVPAPKPRPLRGKPAHLHHCSQPRLHTPSPLPPLHHTHHPHAPPPAPPQRQQSYTDLKKLFEDASKVDPNWDKVFFQYARWGGGGATGEGAVLGVWGGQLKP